MLTGGFFMVPREVFECEYADDPKLMAVLFRLIGTVNYEPCEWHGERIEAGQRAIGYEKFAEETGIPKTTLIRVFNKLEKIGIVDRKRTAKFTIITLKKYISVNECGPQVDRKWTANGPQMDPMEESNKAIKQKSNKEGGRRSRAYPPLTPEQKDSLISIYGEANVNQCIEAIKDWKISQGRCPEVDYALLDRWIREDLEEGKLKLPPKAQSFDIAELERSAYERYRKKGTGHE